MKKIFEVLRNHRFLVSHKKKFFGDEKNGNTNTTPADDGRFKQETEPDNGKDESGHQGQVL